MRGRALSERASPLLAAAVVPPHSRCLLGRTPVEGIEAEAVRFAIMHYGGRMAKVARRLRIGRPTLYRKLDSRGRDVSDPKTPAW